MNQRNCIKFCLKIKLNVQEHLKCWLFGESTMSRTQVQLWYNRFKKHREDARNGPLSTLAIGKNILLLQNKMSLHNSRITIKVVANDVGKTFDSCQAIFTDI